MSFVAAPPSPTPPAVIAGDGWWPDLTIADFKSLKRIPNTVTDARIREALLTGMIDAARQLQTWRAAQEAAGIEKLEDIEGPTFNGEKEKVILWRKAVFATAAAELADTHNDITATAAGRERTEIRATSADEHRRDATQAIRAIKGLGRNRVALK